VGLSGPIIAVFSLQTAKLAGRGPLRGKWHNHMISHMMLEDPQPPALMDAAMDVQPAETLQSMFRHVLLTQNYIHQLDLVEEALIEVSDHFDDHNVHRGSQLIEHMRSVRQLKTYYRSQAAPGSHLHGLPSDLANWAGKTEGRTALEKESFQSIEHGRSAVESQVRFVKLCQSRRVVQKTCWPMVKRN